MFVMPSAHMSSVPERQVEWSRTRNARLLTSKSETILARHRKNSNDYRNRTLNNNRSDSVITKTQTSQNAYIKRKLFKAARANFFTESRNFFRSNSSVQLQAPSTRTVFIDPNPTPGVTEVKNKIVVTSKGPMIPKGLPSETPDIKAMRYYRLWIYTCNVVLLMAVIIFCGVAGKVLIADYRRLLVADLNLNQPNFIYAYLAIIMQSGFLQLIGCLGALRLSEKLLNAYWLLLLLLLIGDVVIGIFWMFKFDKIMETLEPILRTRLSTEYGNSNEFSDLWDRLQNDSRCCGVIGPQDFTNRTYPSSCCASGDISEQISVSKRPLASAVVFKNDELSAAQQKSNLSDIADTTWSHVVSETREPKSMSTCKAVYPQGCKDSLASWLRSTADILFVIGYCVIAFLKLCFLGILRYEIREMIQKIKLLQNEMASPILEQELEPQQLTQVTSPSVNGEVHVEQKVLARDKDRSRMSSGESERESLLVHENTPPRYLKSQRHYGCADGAAGGHTIETDTYSNCALLVDDSGAAAAAKSLNGNNNFELTEFDTRAPTYRRKQLGASFPTSSRSLTLWGLSDSKTDLTHSNDLLNAAQQDFLNSISKRQSMTIYYFDQLGVRSRVTHRS